MTTPLPDETTDAWRTLDLGGGADEFSLATVRLNLDAGYGPVRLARGKNGEPELLIPTQPGRRLPEGLSSETVQVKVVAFIVGGRTQPFIDLSCISPELQAPFRQLVNDVIRRLREGSAPEQAVAAAIAEFRDLLRRQRPHDIEALIGLFGELLLLNDLLAVSPQAAQNWTGSLGQRHDFSSLQTSAEVKSTLKRAGKTVHVTSLEQLRPPSDSRPLFLVHTVLERTGSAGATVRDLIAEAVRTASDQSVINRALRAIQLHNWHSDDLLAGERFALIRRDVYRVDSSFPKLDADSFRPGCPPAGVLGIEYTLDLEHARAWQLDASEVPEFIRSLAAVTS
jgi:hypothetical protein